MRSNISYTNKDFNSIYSELLTYGKTISSEWDPTNTDESDPGIVLLKLAAILGDKDSYNIDKNILELMPASVTQVPAARQLFEQCGYSMKYYRSAEGLLSLTVVKHPGEEGKDYLPQTDYTYTVPQFTMFTDEGNTVVYTTTEPAVLSYKVEHPVKVIQGTATNYTVNNDPLITLSNLDNDNRLYFTETDIAENGIFVTNVDSSRPSFRNYADWKMVTNLETQPAGTKCYKFGLTLDESICYIEFPDDIDLLFGEGINITYVRTSGRNGNISMKQLDRFYVTSKLTRTTVVTGETTSVEVNKVNSENKVEETNIFIANTLPITGGSDPETVDDAYKSYKRVKGTFDTLVSLTDYTNYMITSQSASNGFVCDRTNDIQHSYSILSESSDGRITHSMIEPASEQNTLYKKQADGSFVSIETPSMTAFDLCIYGLNFVPVVETEGAFNTTFLLTDGEKYKNVLSDSEQQLKSMQHDYIGFEPYRMLMFKNKYDIRANVVPSYTLSGTEEFQIKLNIETALYKALNSKELSFGEQVPIETIQSVILNADERIKSLIDFVSPKYETYAVYMNDKNEFKELRIDHNSLDGGFLIADVPTKSYFKNNRNNLFVRDNLTTLPRKVTASELYDPDQTYYMWNQELHDLWMSFRSELYAKSILAGVTPLYDEDTSYKFGVNQTNVKEHENVTYITTNAEIPFKQTGEYEWVSEELKQNESILLSAPNFVEENSFSSYVKIVYEFEEDLLPATYHELKNNEFIVLMWKATTTDEAYTYIKYDASKSSLANVLQLEGMKLPAKQESITDAQRAYFRKLPTGVRLQFNSKAEDDNLGKIPNKFVEELTNTKTYEVLTGLQTVKTYNVNEIHVNNNVNGSSDIYWILNYKNSLGNYELFSEGQTEYTLGSNEYFIYTNKPKSVFHLLGEGTKIKRSKNWLTKDPIWSVPAITYEQLLVEGADILNDKWYTIETVPTAVDSIDNQPNNCLWATEMQQVLIGPGSSVVFTRKDKSNIPPETINNIEKAVSDYNISYQDSSGNINEIATIQASDITWYVKSLLNIDVSNETPQIVYDNQTIYLTLEDDPDVVVVQGKDQPKYLLCNKPLSLVGGINLPVKNTLKKTEFISFIEFDSQKDTEDVSYNSDSFTAVITAEATDKTCIVNIPTFSVLEGAYLLQINSSDNVDKLEVSKSSQASFSVSPLLNSTEHGKVKTYKLVVTPEDSYLCDIDLTVTCTVSSDTSDVSLYIQPLYKYTNTNFSEFDASSNELFEDAVLDKLSALDKYQDFNYTYVPKNKIENPLESEAFFKTTHIYNQFTIAQWDAVMDNINTVDVVN